jgi:hypothetical protein
MSQFIKLCLAALVTILTAEAALAAEPIIIKSYNSLSYAKVACLNVESPAGIAECKFYNDTRDLGRKLENEVRSQMATTTRCQGVDVFRLTDGDYDGEINLSELADQIKQAHWSLLLHYRPGQIKHDWALIPYTGGDLSGGKLVSSGVVIGEGTASQIADQICTVVMKRGADIH